MKKEFVEPEKNSKLIDFYSNYCLGTEYFLSNHIGNLSPITFSITRENDQYVFTPSEMINDPDGAGIYTTVVKDKSLLSGATKIMALATNYSVSYTHKIEELNLQEPSLHANKRFYFNKNKKVSVDLYIDYTNSLVLDDDTDYEPLAPYIFPSYHEWQTRYERKLLPKQLIHINLLDTLHESYHNMYNAKKFYDNFLYGFKDKDIIAPLKALKIKEGIDYPTKLVLYGVCDSFKYGIQTQTQSIVAILYINHKISLDSQQKFKEICDKNLNDLLKSLNMTSNDIKNITVSKLEKDFDTFPKLHKLMYACSMLYDPQRLKTTNSPLHKLMQGPMLYDPQRLKTTNTPNNIIEYSLITDNEDREYNEKEGMRRWGTISKYYPELFKGLKTIFDFYFSKVDQYEKEILDDYDQKINTISLNYYNDLLNSKVDIEKNNNYIIKIVEDCLKNVAGVRMNTGEELFNFFDMLNQYFLDNISKVLQKYYLQKIIEYKNEHPKARKIVLEYKDEYGTGGISNRPTNKIFIYHPLGIEFLPEEYRKILDHPLLASLKASLLNICLFYGTIPRMYVNGKPVKHEYMQTHLLHKFVIEDIKDALEPGAFKFQLVNRNTRPAKLEEVSGLNRSVLDQHFNEVLTITYEDFKAFVDTIVSSGPISFKLTYRYMDQMRPYILPPGQVTKYNQRQAELGYIQNWGVHVNRTIDDIIKSNHDQSRLRRDIVFYVQTIFDKDALLKNLDKIMQIPVIRQAFESDDLSTINNK